MTVSECCRWQIFDPKRDDSAQKMQHRAPRCPRTNTIWRLLAHPGEASWCVSPRSLILPITSLMVCNLDQFVCGSPWQFSGTIFDLQKRKMLDKCLLEGFSWPVECIDADYRSPASCKTRGHLHYSQKDLYVQELLIHSFVFQYKIFVS